MNKYKESIDRIAFNFGLDCLDGKEDPTLAEDISNLQELLEKYMQLNNAVTKLSNLLDSYDICPYCPYDMCDGQWEVPGGCDHMCTERTDSSHLCWIDWALSEDM